MQATKADQERWRERCLGSFRYFTQVFMHPDWYDSEFHGPLCDFLQSDVSKDKLVVLARGHLKTTIVTKLYRIWRTTKDPSLRTLVAMNTATNAFAKNAETKDFVENNKLYRLLFPEVIPDFTGRKSRWSNESAALRRPVNFAEGTFDAIGVGGNVVSRHYDLIIEDDTIAPQKDEVRGEELMPSRDDIEKAIGWHKLTLPLLVDVRKSERICVGTRWAPFDLINHIKKYETSGSARVYTCYDKPARLEDGSAAYKRLGDGGLEVFEHSLGPYMFSALYLNMPLDPSQMVFNPQWIKYFDEVPTEGMTRVSIDPADPPTGSSTQCYSAIIAALNNRAGLYVLETQRKRVDDDSLITEAFLMVDRWNASVLRIEADRYAHLVLAFERKNRERMGEGRRAVIVEPVKTKGSNKQDRICSRLQPLAANGFLWLRKGMNELEDEMCQFPAGKFFDLLDALAWQVGTDFIQPDYKLEGKREARPANVFSFDEIIASTRRPTVNLPFDVQLKGVPYAKGF